MLVNLKKLHESIPIELLPAYYELISEDLEETKHYVMIVYFERYEIPADVLPRIIQLTQNYIKNINT